MALARAGNLCMSLSFLFGDSISGVGEGDGNILLSGLRLCCLCARPLPLHPPFFGVGLGEDESWSRVVVVGGGGVFSGLPPSLPSIILASLL